ncbi:hypothetical protein SAMN04488598_11648 [Halanaerobium congolense]|jgi:hypothetical protein|uniref:Uncharacterized protein n=1 Tax=Halanaerobium congolense TaxID=54121 RepID=A0A1I0AZK3_9FIRM|nr:MULTISPECIES: hypothetical protein [Halanaerobium]PTX16555.1 hypothetical protein C7953_1278 [Halanaerobium congolense]PUU87228.1 MAG: hypothetical protein CI949_3684 [Halanaerobium sp.]SDF60033.1 hypothetical protein SAMN04488598_11648 [Halanaerobium congolense]SES99679.1 hypothetical protein SAMN04515652_1163 [Halanaerobium congolense]SFP35758.1 hypothetical protein SAMN04488596_1153 [Halanaerobium congolense]
MGGSYVGSMIKMFLGPHGRYLSNLYLQNQLLINSFVIGVVLIKKTIDYRSDKSS